MNIDQDLKEGGISSCKSCQINHSHQFFSLYLKVNGIHSKVKTFENLTLCVLIGHGYELIKSMQSHENME